MSSMEFWGVEVKAGKPVTVTPENDFMLHLSHAALGESKKAKNSDSVSVYVTVDGEKLVLGTLSSEKFPQLAFDLVLEREFELSHNWKNGSVYFTGYKSVLSDDEDSDMDSEYDEDFSVTLDKVEKLKPVAAAAKPKATKPKSKPTEPAKPDSSSDDSDDSDDDSDDSDDSDDDLDDSDDEEAESGDDESGEEMSIEGDDSGDESDDEESEDEETPTPKKKPESGKKRANDSDIKTPVPNKKANQSTPQKSDGKKGGHTDTPHPVKKDGKPAAKPKSGGSFNCKPCNRSFTSESAMESHAKAKHAAK